MCFWRRLFVHCNTVQYNTTLLHSLPDVGAGPTRTAAQCGCVPPAGCRKEHAVSNAARTGAVGLPVPATASQDTEGVYGGKRRCSSKPLIRRTWVCMPIRTHVHARLGKKRQSALHFVCRIAEGRGCAANSVSRFAAPPTASKLWCPCLASSSTPASRSSARVQAGGAVFAGSVAGLAMSRQVIPLAHRTQSCCCCRGL